MPGHTALGGLTLRDLLRRTARESWEDSVFGQGGRMAFYQFLAIFPSLLVFLGFSAHIVWGDRMRDSLHELSRQILPEAVAGLFQQVMNDVGGRSISGMRLVFVCAGAMWSAFNTTWAMIYGLNRAYEVKERRSWRTLAVTITVLTASLALIGFGALFLIFGINSDPPSAGQSESLRIAQWIVLGATLAFCFAVLYRFAPDLRAHRPRWTAPGTVLALLLWLGSTVAARIYFNDVNDYSRSYGRLNGVAILLLWLYFTNGAILIGGEMNSEIDKAAQSVEPNQSTSLDIQKH